MKRILLFISLILIISAFSSCKKCPCGAAEGLLPAFIGFSESDTDTLILRRYANTGTFSQLMDTLFLNDALIKFERRNDTLSPTYNSISIPMNEGNDYEVLLPSVNKTYRISGIVEQKNSIPCNGIFSMDKRYCVNGIPEYTVNGVKVKASLYERFIYLK